MLFKPGHSFFRRTFFAHWREIGVFCTTLLPGPAFAVNVTVNVTNDLFPVASTVYGIHTLVLNLLTELSLSSVTLSNGAIEFQIIGDVRPDYAVQVSTNLMDWSVQFITNSPAMRSIGWIHPRGVADAVLPHQNRTTAPLKLSF
jgi:hypothetical protein